MKKKISMHEEGVKRFLNEGREGMGIVCKTSEFTYWGTILQLNESWIVIEDSVSKSIVDYSDIYYYCFIANVE